MDLNINTNIEGIKINKEGKEMTELIYNNASNFNEGLAFVEKEGKNYILKIK